MSMNVTPVTQRRQGWGMSTEGVSQVLYPTSAEDISEAFRIAKSRGWTVGFWGNGRSYGDAAINESQLILDFGRMNTVLSWDPSTGIIVCEPGVTIDKLWRHVIGDSYWPPVVSGTSFTTMGGIAAANIHGKNNWKHGPIGEHILAFTFVTPDGQIREVTKESDLELFSTAIGGFGWLGAFASITIKMKRVYSGRLDVLPFSCRNLDEMFAGFERCNNADFDYVVGWIDAFPDGADLGRGQIHAARYYDEGEDPAGKYMLRETDQAPSTTLFGVFPKKFMWIFIKPFANRYGMRLINAVRYFLMTLELNHRAHPQPHAEFNFLLDFVPNWQFIYKPTGLIQYQLFIPKAHAKEVFRRALELQQELGIESWLLVMKRHREDGLLMSHAVDGYSLAQDFVVTNKNRQALYDLCQQFSDMVTKVGGRFYFAKDSVLESRSVRVSLGAEVLGKFFALKRRLDPDKLLQSNLYRRVFGEMEADEDL
jgi:decaprenylphospho-beta-D-ribofuranose 2-oxidase